MAPALVGAMMAACAPGADAAAAATLKPIEFADIAGWADDSHGEALAAFRRGCEAVLKATPGAAAGAEADGLAAACKRATALPQDTGHAAARRFFETHFTPRLVVPEVGERGLFTGYFEPVIEASRAASPAFPVPVLGPPPGLVALDAAGRGHGLADGFSHALALGDRLAAAPTRAEIAAGALAGAVSEIAWLADPIDAFFLHVQGSGRLTYGDGSSERITYAGKNGHPYTSIGKLLADRGEIAREEVDMERIRAWLAADRERGARLMNENRSYIFFRKVADDRPDLGPIGQLGVALTPKRSLAVDRAHYRPNQPLWLETTLPATPNGRPSDFRRLMIAQDTGSAIRGAVRGDVFFGSGAPAGAIAGAMRAPGRLIVLEPRCDEEC